MSDIDNSEPRMNNLDTVSQNEFIENESIENGGVGSEDNFSDAQEESKDGDTASNENDTNKNAFELTSNIGTDHSIYEEKDKEDLTSDKRDSTEIIITPIKYIDTNQEDNGSENIESNESQEKRTEDILPSHENTETSESIEIENDIYEEQHNIDESSDIEPGSTDQLNYEKKTRTENSHIINQSAETASVEMTTEEEVINAESVSEDPTERDAQLKHVPPIPILLCEADAADITSVLAAKYQPNVKPISPAIPPRRNSSEKKAVYPVPPLLSQEMKSEKFRKNLALTHAKDTPPSPPPRHASGKEPLVTAAEINLIVSRYRKTSHNFQSASASSKENIKEGQTLLRSSYSALVKTFLELPSCPTIPSTEDDRTLRDKDEITTEEEVSEIDWNFWSEVVNDFPKVTNDNPDKLEAMITEGLPPQIRGIIWQLIANSKSKEHLEVYETLLPIESPHENSIRRDIKRTNFIPENKVESLYNVMKAYSLYDADVGYTQGMAFIVTPILLNCSSEPDAFGLLISLMKNYGLRDFFLPGMPGLMLTLYHFDRLLEETSPQLYNYLTREGVRSTMYATQWFLTFFAYKFPLGFVLRIFDIVFVEGIEAILKFAVILMIKNEDKIMTLKFDQLLDFLKLELFFYYSKDSIKEREEVAEDEPVDQDLSDVESVLKKELTRTTTVDSLARSKKFNSRGIHDDDYDIDLFVHEAMEEVHFTPISLSRYAAEYDEIHEIELQKEQQYEHIRIQNHQLQREVKKLEHDYTVLNREHVTIANELIQNRLHIETLNDEKNDLYLTVLDLKKRLDEEVRKQTLPNPDSELPNDLKFDLEQAMQRNSEVMTENMRLQDKISEFENTIEQMKTSTPPSPSASETKTPLQTTGWSGFKSVFTKPI